MPEYGKFFAVLLHILLLCTSRYNHSIFVPSAHRAQGTMLSCARVSVILAVCVICHEVSSP